MSRPLGSKNIEVEVARLRVLLAQALSNAGGGDYITLTETTKLTSTSWDGDAFSTVAKTLIDLSAVFGAPAGIKEVNLRVTIRDSGAGSSDASVTFSNGPTTGYGKTCRCFPADDRWVTYDIDVPCNSDGDIYYETLATGSGTLDVSVQIWKYKV